MKSAIVAARSRAKPVQRPVKDALARAAQTARYQLDRAAGAGALASKAIISDGRRVARQGRTAVRRAPVMTGVVLLAVAAGGVFLTSAPARAWARKRVQRATGRQGSEWPAETGPEDASPVRPSGEAPARTRKARTSNEHQEALLDEGLEESFPASDPVSALRP